MLEAMDHRSMPKRVCQWRPVVLMWHMVGCKFRQQWSMRQHYHPHKANKHIGDGPAQHEDHSLALETQLIPRKSERQTPEWTGKGESLCTRQPAPGA